MRHGRLVDPATLAQQIRDIRVGARLRGLEVTVDGVLEQIHGKPYLRLGNTNQPLALAVLTQKVQIDGINKKIIAPTRDEQQAFESLLAKWKGKRTRLRVTGPLRKLDNGEGLVLEVRGFSPSPRRT